MAKKKEEEKQDKVIGKGTVKNDLFIADEDVFIEKIDGRKIMVAREGQSIPLQRAMQLGAVEPPTEEKKKSAPENKSK